MPRRKPYTKLEKAGSDRPETVKGMGDVVFKGFKCLDPACNNFQFIRKDELSSDFDIECGECGTHLRSGDETKFFDYILRHTNGTVIEEGKFSILHDDYLAEACEYKYCLICCTLKPLEYFDRHERRASGRQGECRLCKKAYNAIKNQSRITDQHREAAQRRRLYLELSGSSPRINSLEVSERFRSRCFKCGKTLNPEADASERPLDHTLPVSFLWPLNTQSATLLCKRHNGEKSGKWPSEYYTVEQLKNLAILTGIPFDVLNGPPSYNPEALQRLQDCDCVDSLLQKFAARMDEIIKLRNRILRDTKVDFFRASRTISKAWIEKADSEA